MDGAHAPAPRLPLLRRLWSFGGVSGVGWCLDTVVFALLVHLGRLHAGPANAISAGLAVLFVFAMTHERLFGGRRDRRGRHLASYLSCQLALVAGAAWLISALVNRLEVEPVLVKMAVTPLTFAANFAVLSVITRNRRPGPAGPAES